MPTRKADCSGFMDSVARPRGSAEIALREPPARDRAAMGVEQPQPVPLGRHDAPVIAHARSASWDVQPPFRRDCARGHGRPASRKGAPAPAERGGGRGVVGRGDGLGPEQRQGARPRRRGPVAGGGAVGREPCVAEVFSGIWLSVGCSRVIRSSPTTRPDPREPGNPAPAPRCAPCGPRRRRPSRLVLGGVQGFGHRRHQRSTSKPNPASTAPSFSSNSGGRAVGPVGGAGEADLDLFTSRLRRGPTRVSRRRRTRPRARSFSQSGGSSRFENRRGVSASSPMGSGRVRAHGGTAGATGGRDRFRLDPPSAWSRRTHEIPAKAPCQPARGIPHRSPMRRRPSRARPAAVVGPTRSAAMGSGAQRLPQAAGAEMRATIAGACRGSGAAPPLTQCLRFFRAGPCRSRLLVDGVAAMGPRHAAAARVARQGPGRARRVGDARPHVRPGRRNPDGPARTAPLPRRTDARSPSGRSTAPRALLGDPWAEAPRPASQRGQGLRLPLRVWGRVTRSGQSVTASASAARA